MENQPPRDPDNELNTLEDASTITNDVATPTVDASPPSDSGQDSKHQPSLRTVFFLRNLKSLVNIYLIGFLIVLAAAGFVVVTGIRQSPDDNTLTITGNEQLSQEELEEIGLNDAKIGDPKQTLTIESNSVFSGRVLVRDDLDVAGTIRVGGRLNLPGITVAGTSAFDELTANSLSVSGNTSLQGQLSVQNNISVSGSATFAGNVSAARLTVQNLQLSGDLTFNRHIDAGGGTPGRSNGSALGSGGTSSVSGTDTAGTITINTGNNPPAGCFITVSFAQAFNSTPHVVVTPVGSTGAALNYYVTRDSNSFRLCSTNPAGSGTSFSFDYIIID